MRYIFAGLLWLVAGYATAAVPLCEQLTTFFQQREPDYAQQLQVKILTPEEYWPSCSTPHFALSPNSRRWGRITVDSRCGARHILLQAQVTVRGDYYVSASDIAQGELITLDQLQRKTGQLETLPSGAWLTQPKLPLVALQRVKQGSVLTHNQFRRPWLVVQGQQVNLSFSGVGFQALTRVTALDNGAEGQMIRVRTQNGKIRSARIVRSGEVAIE